MLSNVANLPQAIKPSPTWRLKDVIHTQSSKHTLWRTKTIDKIMIVWITKNAKDN